MYNVFSINKTSKTNIRHLHVIGVFNLYFYVSISSEYCFKEKLRRAKWIKYASVSFYV